MSQINISQGNIAGECNLKCAFSFQYPNSNCIATNWGNMGLIEISYDKSNIPPVTYNGNKYQVSRISLYTSSSIPAQMSFYFNQNQSDALLIISHAPVLGGPLLMIVIPIINSTSVTTGTNILTEIIGSVASNAPKGGEKTTVNLSNYSLNNIIPYKPFYNFENNEGICIAFGIENAIPLSDATLKKLKSLIGRGSTDAYNSNNVIKIPIYYNKDGPGKEASGDIYIDCQPVDDSEETVDIPAGKLGAKYDVGDNMKDWFYQIINSIIFQCIIVALILFLLLYLLRLGVKQLSSGG